MSHNFKFFVIRRFFKFSALDSVRRFLGNQTHQDYFKLLRQDGDTLIIGARNVIYNVSLPDLTENVEQVRRLARFALFQRFYYGEFRSWEKFVFTARRRNEILLFPRNEAFLIVICISFTSFVV